MDENRKVIVVGGGLAGLSAAMQLANLGIIVELVSLTKVKRSHSVCAQGGINAALNLKPEEEDSPYVHAYDTIKGGDFLADQPPVLEMCLAAPRIIKMLDNFGCPFNRGPSGNLDVRRFGGTLYHRTVFCGASTGQQLMYTLDEQVRRREHAGRVIKRENHEFVRLVTDHSGRACGIILMNLFNNRLEILRGDAVIIATGGPGVIFKMSTNSTFCTGAANGRLFLQGMAYANPEFIQIHPTAIPGRDKLRLISESVRGEGGRVWVPGDSSKRIVFPDGSERPCGETGAPWYFLEDMYPAYGNLVSRDVGARAILRVCEAGLGIDGRMEAYLDVTHLPEKTRHKLEVVLDIYKKFTGEDPNTVPMRIFPAVHYSMGGAWVDWPAADDPDRDSRFRQMTNIPGCFNCGESDFQYHGANRLGANSLLSCLFAGLVSGDEASRFIEAFGASQATSSDFDRALQQEKEENARLLSASGKENIFVLHEEIAKIMVRNVTVKRNNRDLQETMDKLKEFRERLKNVSVLDSSPFANKSFHFVRQMGPMLELALAITKGALLRNEFRGSHYKPEFPERDDEHWLKTTVAVYAPEEPEISYLPVDTRHVAPTLRDYTKSSTGKIELTNIPDNIRLPI
ncbi:succinate dehydrogenase flavoprotein [Chlamydia pneumoniae TW-183]|uniref:succinate dehydrogenase n=3 Tax=Chlamydia pneumoniae TaxID=83558 RepID=Q9Z7B7_CHLPN|nr:succinate dehydrogenase flavoprotein subunit [Chlamydia pneumoniae]AAD18927.1 Succinate Dehydrogenase [Chlamydia pneumoniae CWL029]AAF38855.1 succinate dehydrogenase, flavoprotein subunit [Chlamydia pneumoniae AR39]AAP98746.1 succinate dehydrogenase flavoprotein [Chlamydia pneumoniae TW-183]CRI33308.1 Succinate dehydrogenase flavoprotein subunit [Chlamydia pneumoniae]CRI36171.1 Succinate dehydrogenase flavoprotein subunit [Chlamydia pneumoniae]